MDFDIFIMKNILSLRPYSFIKCFPKLFHQLAIQSPQKADGFQEKFASVRNYVYFQGLIVFTKKTFLILILDIIDLGQYSHTRLSKLKLTMRIRLERRNKVSAKKKNGKKGSRQRKS